MYTQMYFPSQQETSPQLPNQHPQQQIKKKLHTNLPQNLYQWEPQNIL